MPKTGNTSAATVKKARATKNAPTREQIALRAYEIYLERGGAPGHELDDWTRAERELTPRNGKGRRKVEAKSAAA